MKLCFTVNVSGAHKISHSFYSKMKMYLGLFVRENLVQLFFFNHEKVYGKKFPPVVL